MTNKKASSEKRKAKSEIRFVFFGTSRIAVGILDALERAGYLPALVVATPDAKKGRGMTLAPPPAKEWAEARNITVLQPTKLDSGFSSQLEALNSKLFVVVDYGKILPREALGIPKRGTLNVHFSLLPRWRGTSPIRSAILADDRHIGTSIILLSEGLDEGPVVAQKPLRPPEWPMRAGELEGFFIEESGQLLVQVLPAWLAGEIEAREQNHDIATYCKKIRKEDGLLDLSADPHENLRKIYAYEGWPGTYAFFERPSTRSGQAAAKRIRVQILDARVENDALVVERVKPEGKRDMPYQDFLNSGAKVV